MDLEAGRDIGVLGHLISGNCLKKHVVDAPVPFFACRSGDAPQRYAGRRGRVPRGCGGEEPVERLRHELVRADRRAVERRHAMISRPDESGIIRSGRRRKRVRDLGLGFGEIRKKLQVGADAA